MLDPKNFSDLSNTLPGGIAAEDDILIRHLNGGSPGPTKFYRVTMSDVFDYLTDGLGATSWGSITGTVTDQSDLVGLVSLYSQFIYTNSSATIEPNKDYIVDTSSGVITLTLPASPDSGDTIRVTGSGTWGNSVIIGRNGNTINSAASDADLTALHSHISVFVYVGGSIGWNYRTYVDYASIASGLDGTLVTTSDTGSVTNSMLAGSIDLGTKVTGTLRVNLGGTGSTNLPEASNYSPTGATLEGHLEGIDTAIGDITPIGIAGSGTEIQFRSSGTELAAITGSSVSGSDVTLAGTITADGSGLTGIPTSAVSSGTFADARISETSVTQHEGALSVGLSQVSPNGNNILESSDNGPTQMRVAVTQGDGTEHGLTFPAYGGGGGTLHFPISDSGSETVAFTGHVHAASDITSGTLADARISESSVTQHEAALSVATSQVTGTLPVANGGTGVTSLSSLDAADFGSGSATDGQVLTSDGAGNTAWETLAGSGTVTSVAVSGSDGIEVDSGSPITGAGTIALGLNKTSTLAFLNLEDGADVTDATNVDAAGAVMESDTSTASMSFVVDEDDMSSDSATKIPTQQSVKAYVDASPITGTYRNLWVGAGAMTPRTTNGADPQAVEFATNDINLDVLDFDAATEEGVNFAVAMPDEWDRGTVKVKAYWTAASGSGAVVFGIRAKANSDDDAIDSAYGTEQLITDTLLTADDSHISPASSALTIGGTPALGDLVIFEVTREVANGSDTLGVDARLIGVSIQYKELTSTVSIW